MGAFRPGARAILNAGDAVSIARAPTLAQQPHWFAQPRTTRTLEPCAELERLTAIVGDHRLIERAKVKPRSTRSHRTCRAMHNRLNPRPRPAGAVELGVPPARFIAAIPNLTLPDGRYDRIALAGGQR